MLNGFKEFIMKGNVLDLAVAVIIGAAFGQIITALVESVLMPAISAVVGSPNFDSFAMVTFNGNDIKFGVLLTAIVNFLLVAAAVYFAIVMPMNKMIELATVVWASTRPPRKPIPTPCCSPKSATLWSPARAAPWTAPVPRPCNSFQPSQLLLGPRFQKEAAQVFKVLFETNQLKRKCSSTTLTSDSAS